MTKEDFMQVESSQRQHHEVLEHQVRIGVEVLKEEYTLFSMLKPKVSIDGNKYCVLYGDNLQDGICGFGDTIYKAIIDFNNSFTKLLKVRIDA